MQMALKILINQALAFMEEYDHTPYACVMSFLANKNITIHKLQLPVLLFIDSARVFLSFFLLQILSFLGCLLLGPIGPKPN